MANIIDLEGIGPTYAQKLKDADVKTTDDLLEAGATRKGREDLRARYKVSSECSYDPMFYILNAN